MPEVGFSPPPQPPADYRGPTVRLVDDGNVCLATLHAADDAVRVRLDGCGDQFADSASGIAQILGDHLDVTRVRPVTGSRPWATRPSHVALLTFLTAAWVELNGPDGLRQHVTLAYALPLTLEPSWQTWTTDHANLLAAGLQVVVLPASALVAAEPAQTMFARHDRLLQANLGVRLHEHSDVPGFMRTWASFSRWRYGRSVHSEEQEALQGILTMSGATVRDLIQVSTVIARSVVVAHPGSRTLFDVMATWNPDCARSRPGILSAVRNALDAFERGWRYSLCYGQSPYKDSVVGGARRLTLGELAKSQ